MIQTLFGTPQPSFLDKMKQAVTRTRENLSERIDEVMALTKEIDSTTLDDLEGILLGADLGMKTTQEILSKLREKADRKQIKDAAELKKLIKEQVLAILNATPRPCRQTCKRRAGNHYGCGSKRHGKNHHDRQAGACACALNARPFCFALQIHFAPQPLNSLKSGAHAPAWK